MYGVNNTKRCMAFTTDCGLLQNKLVNNVMLESGDEKTEVVALWDTGASNSCISYDAVFDLDLVQVGTVTSHTPSGSMRQRTYLLDVCLPNEILIPDVLVSDSEIGAQGIGILIGMDIIGMGDFAVSNYNNCTSFTFRIPSQRKADYTFFVEK